LGFSASVKTTVISVLIVTEIRWEWRLLERHVELRLSDSSNGSKLRNVIFACVSP